MDSIQFSDRRKADLPTDLKRRASDRGPDFEWMLAQVRASLAAAADTAGELSAINKDINELRERQYKTASDLSVLKVDHSKDIANLKEKVVTSKEELKEFKQDIKDWKDKFSLTKILPIVISATLVSVGIIKAIVIVVHYIDSLK